MGGCMAKIRGMDLDDLLAYQTIKMVKIRDRRLGAVHHILQIAIFIYIVVFTIIIQKRYLRSEAPTGSFRATVQQPGAWPEASSLPYCMQNQRQFPAGYDNYNCTYFLGLDLTYPPAMMDSILVSTRIKDTEYPIAANSACTDPVPLSTACAPPPNLAAVSNAPSKRYYMAGIEDYTLFIEHAVFGRQNKIAVTNMQCVGKLKYKNNKNKDPNDEQIQEELSLDYKKEHPARGGDVLKMSTVLKAADISSLDVDAKTNTNKTLRYEGVLILMVVEYGNKGYSTERLKYSYYAYQVPGVSVVAQAPSKPTTNGFSQRTWYGIRVIFVLAGTVGKFDFPSLLTALVSGAVLVKAASTVVDLLLLYIMPDKALYAKHKFEVTDDFSDVREKREQSEKDIKMHHIAGADTSSQ